MTSSGCNTTTAEDDSSPPPAHQTSLPGEPVQVLDGEPTELALGVVGALYDQAPIVVLAGADQPDRHADAAAAAVDLGAPLLLAPPEPDPSLREELDRLQTSRVVVADSTARSWAERSEQPATPLSADATAPPGEELPATTAAEPLPEVTLLLHAETESAANDAAAATAEAAGAQVVTTDSADPRGDPAVIAALSESSASHVIALGASFGPVEQLAQRLAVAATGVELPGGGQLVFPGRLLIALYGHPGDTALGALGEQPMTEALARTAEVAAEYESLVDEPVVPTLEIITTIASASPGPEGDYSLRTPPEQLRPWIDAAAAEGMYVVLDLQPGHTDFLTQAQEYEELLTEPHVGLALDPEWRLAPDQRHMVEIGSVDAEEVNQVTEWLAELTAEHHLPQKLLILHQFTLGMITNRDAVATDYDEVAVLIHADGFGTPSEKFDTWNALQNDAPEVWWGWKNFYDEDQPTFTPAETVDVEPLPRFVSYQ
ncbi:hypothetical protein JQS43_13980 [Natronosporangium hydrolyticum]|uniref:Lipoprotein n=1 Tax=Natronosporangium hydrolyticum TaxID=2811111 RepID=A0A895Y518_9ACTN|nr:hypothetical protein [Natronosporangium hydrolyticum]QSB12794.1 hypothetical protein JQS43_13980 [Natronosporangium hydrolyticum]